MDRTFMSQVAALDKAKPYFIYCRSGARSGQACALMSNQGFEVYNLAGGIMGWSGQNPLIRHFVIQSHMKRVINYCRTCSRFKEA